MNRRYFIKVGAFGTLVSTVCLSQCTSLAEEELTTDVVVVGGTPAGIMAAIAAARSGMNVSLVEYHRHIGGLSTSGLGKSDIENKNAIAGLFKEFTENILRYYTEKYGADSENVTKCKQGYYYEPSVAEQVFKAMLEAESTITVVTGYQLEKALTQQEKVRQLFFVERETGKTRSWKAKVFIDATYEGDVYALAGAGYRLGRESKESFGEAHAGKIFFDYNDNIFLEGSTGEGDRHLPAYTYRLCLTDDPANSYVMKTPPAGYNRENYIGYFEDLREGRLGGPKVFREGHGYYKAHFDTMVRVFSFAEIPNRKYDVNTNPRPLGFPFPEENLNYVESDWKTREKVFQRHRDLAMGLLYFIQNDEEVPEPHRILANQYHLPLDEFTDNGHFPWQLYVREARRLKGEYTLTENDVTLREGARRTTVFNDSIIAGEFPIDSFPCSKQPAPNKKVLEGYIGMFPIAAYQIPYRVLLPEVINGLLVPVAASTTHVAYSTVRMEPLWMGIGQAAGLAAALAIKNNIEPREVPTTQLQLALIQKGQILTYFDDLDREDPAHEAAQFLGCRGFFDSYQATLNQPLQGSELSRWMQLFTDPDVSSEETSRSETSTISVAAFRKRLETLNSSVAQSGQWLYRQRKEHLPLLKGEACRAFFQIYTEDTKPT
jgi:hypothetical protein